MLKILIVEDDRQLATTLKYLVEDNPRYRVVAIADDLDSRGRRCRSASSRSGAGRPSSRPRHDRFLVAVRMQRFRHSLFLHHRRAPSFPDARSRAWVPDEAVHRRGRPPQPCRGRGHDARPRGATPKMPVNLTLYDQPDEVEPPTADAPGSFPRSARSRPGSSIGSPARRPINRTGYGAFRNPVGPCGVLVSRPFVLTNQPEPRTDSDHASQDPHCRRRDARGDRARGDPRGPRARAGRDRERPRRRRCTCSINRSTLRWSISTFAMA